MNEPEDDNTPQKNATATLAELVARKAAARGGRPADASSARRFERAAAALSASKSKPARRY